jgi:hypothetical protein
MQNFLIYLAMVAIMLQAGGCTSFLPESLNMSTETVETTPPFGSSVRMAVKSQTAFPEAGQDDAPVVGLDGRYAAKAAENYNNGPRDKTERNRPSMFGVVDTDL